MLSRTKSPSNQWKRMKVNTYWPMRVFPTVWICTDRIKFFKGISILTLIELNLVNNFTIKWRKRKSSDLYNLVISWLSLLSLKILCKFFSQADYILRLKFFQSLGCINHYSFPLGAHIASNCISKHSSSSSDENDYRHHINKNKVLKNLKKTKLRIISVSITQTTCFYRTGE